jgi:hypothetical protein
MTAKTQLKQLVVCINNEGYEASLEKRKIYLALRDVAAEKHGLLRIVDESGDDYLYPKVFFRLIVASIRQEGGACGSLATHLHSANQSYGFPDEDNSQHRRCRNGQVAAELKREPARQGLTMSELVETALRLLLRSQRRHEPLSLPNFNSGGTLVDVSDRRALYQAMESPQCRPSRIPISTSSHFRKYLI